MLPQDTSDTTIQERFVRLPKVVQDAITSADIEAHLRELSTSHKLHLDQWQLLENEVMLTLLGFEQPENLASNIQKEVGISAEDAQSLAQDISTVVFEPIRQKLEQELEHPDAQATTVTATEAAGTEIIAQENAEAAAPPSAPAVQPATPPAPSPNIKLTRPSDSTAYKPGEASTERKTVHDDPYREPPH